MKDEQNRVNKFSPLAWILLALVVAVPLIAWGEDRNWQISNTTALSIFPLLGLWAWSVMWTHYAYGTMILTYPDKFKKNVFYSRLTRYLVLALIILHPNLLVWSQWNMRGILPPESIYGYVDSSLKIFVFFGTLSLLTFLSFEGFERLKSKSWVSNNWRWISMSQIIAMTLIFVHALAIGQTTDVAWFEYYWVVLGALLIPCFAIIGRTDWRKR